MLHEAEAGLVVLDGTVELGLGDVFSLLSTSRSGSLGVPLERASKIFGIQLGGSSITRG